MGRSCYDDWHSDESTAKLWVQIPQRPPRQHTELDPPAPIPQRSVMMYSLLGGTTLTSCEVTSLLLHYVLHDDA